MFHMQPLDKFSSLTSFDEAAHERPKTRPDLAPSLKQELEQRLKNIQTEENNLDTLLAQANLTDVLNSVKSIPDLQQIILKRLDSVEGAIRDIIGESEEPDRSLEEFSSFFHEQTALKTIDLALTDLGKMPKKQAPAIPSRTPSNPQNPALLEALKNQNKEIVAQTTQKLNEVLAELQSDEEWEIMPGVQSSNLESLLAEAGLQKKNLEQPLTELRATCQAALAKINTELRNDPNQKTPTNLNKTAKLSILNELLSRAIKRRT